MTEFSTLLRQGAGNAWLFVPSAIVLGGLHGLEPGHSKTMMAAFIVAIRGTQTQAILLGLSATISHTAVVWLIALGGMYYGQRWSAETGEPYLQLASAVLIVGVALWMLWRTWRQQHGTTAYAHDSHDDDVKFVEDHHHHHHHHHHHAIKDYTGPDVAAPGYQDPHELAHADDIRRRFANRDVTTGQIVMFGLTGGLIPCPASITVLLLCLQLKKIALGATLVLGFSVGLALTMVMSGVLAALSVKHVSNRWSGFGEFARKAPYFSGGLILLVGFYVGYQSFRTLV